MKKIIILFLILLSVQIQGQVVRTYSPYKGIVTAESGSSEPAFLSTDTHTVGWYIFDDTENVAVTGDHVTTWGDHLGNNDMNLVGGTPHLTATGIRFDGVGDWLGAHITGLTQPTMIYIVFQQIGYADGRFIVDGHGGGYMGIKQGETEGYISIFAGGAGDIGNSSGFALNTFGIVRAVFSGTSSKLVINGNSPITGDPGTDNPGGITIGGLYYQTLYANCEITEIIFRNQIDSSGDESEIYNYLKNKYNL